MEVFTCFPHAVPLLYSFVPSLWLLNDPADLLHCCRFTGPPPLLLLLSMLALHARKLAGLPPATAPTNGVSWGRLSKERVFPGEKEDEVERGAPDHLFSKLSLMTSCFTTTFHRALLEQKSSLQPRRQHTDTAGKR
eukprot:1159560-Pelagomonas_calceolata.AAC.3